MHGDNIRFYTFFSHYFEFFHNNSIKQIV